jgi:CDGSH-type Zn-finger protein
VSNKLSVTIFDDGPIKVSNANRVRYCGELVETDGDVFLCRCGESKNAPFCDGSHRTVEFKGENELKDFKPIKTWEGRTVRTHFNPNACMHVLYCKPLGALREAELAGDDGAAVEIARVVGLCPSGALSVESKGADLDGDSNAECDVDIVEGGEIRLQRAYDVNVDALEGQPGDRATLCRCGKSKNKPWCDGRHKGRKGFR